MNSIIEAQITLAEQTSIEMERCEDPLYFYVNYVVNRELYDREKSCVENFKKEQVKFNLLLYKLEEEAINNRL